jgi:hypothetical protein
MERDKAKIGAVMSAQHPCPSAGDPPALTGAAARLRCGERPTPPADRDGSPGGIG